MNIIQPQSWSPGQPVPVNANRITLAAIITHLFFPISPRTIERWPLVVRRPNRAAVYNVEEALKYAQKLYDAAYCYKQTAVIQP